MNKTTRINGVIYMHTSPSGKHYIGQTKQKINNRFRSDGSGYKQCRVFYNAIKKYGWNNFKHEILEKKYKYTRIIRSKRNILYTKI